LLAPYLERRLAELVPGAGATIAVLSNNQSSDEALSAVLGGSTTHIHRRPDGKPVAVCDRAVSVSHAERLTLSIAGGRRLVACDAEAVVHRELREWSDLLGGDRMALVHLVTEQSPADNFDAAATRLWSAGECLKKAGLPLETPIVLSDATADRWVLLKAGAATIATWVGSVRDASAPLAVALLVGSADEVL
jgi:enediyne polyketide synthase